MPKWNDSIVPFSREFAIVGCLQREFVLKFVVVKWTDWLLGYLVTYCISNDMANVAEVCYPMIIFIVTEHDTHVFTDSEY